MPVANEALGLSPQEGAKFITAFYLGYALTVLPGGMLADKFGYKKVLSASLVGLAIFSALMSLAQGFTSGFLMRFLLGVAAGPIQSSCLSAISDKFASHQRGTATGIFMTSSSLGISVVNLYAPSLSVHYGWQSVFLFTALIPLLILLICILAFNLSADKLNADKNVAASVGTLKMQDSTNSSVTKTEAGPDLQSARSQSAAANAQLSILEKLKCIASNKDILLLAAAGLFATGTTWGVTTWTNQFMVKQVGISPVEAGSIMVIYGLCAFFAKPLIGFISDKLSMPKNRLAALALFVLAPVLIIFAKSNSLALLQITAPLLGVAAFMYSPLTNALSIHLAPEGMKATSAGFVNLFNQIGSLSAPLILGQVYTSTQSYSSSLMIIAICPIIAAIFLLFISKKKASN